MSNNFFAALDDSGDEAEISKVKVATKKETKKPTAKAAPVEPVKNDRRRGGKDDRNTKQGRGGRAPARDGKRTYDRRSGTGRGKEIKKGGGGARNWGNDKNDARKAEGAVTEGEEAVVLETKPEETEAVTPEVIEEVAAPVPEEVKEEEDKTLAYEDYMLTKSRPDTAAFQATASRDLVDEFAGKATATKAVEEDFLVLGGGKALRKKGSKKDQKQTVAAGFKITSGDEPRRDDKREGDRRGGDRRDGDRRDGDRRGGERRGGGRGGRGGGGGRSSGGRGRGGKQGGAINVSDVNAFPSL